MQCEGYRGRSGYGVANAPGHPVSRTRRGRAHVGDSGGGGRDRPNGTPDSAGVAAAQRLGGIYTDTVSVYESRELSPTVANAAIQAAHDAGGEGVVLNAGTLGLVSWSRGGQVLGASAPGYRWPVSVTGFSGDLAGRVLSVRVAKALGAGQVVVGEKWAALHGVMAGDQLGILGWDGVVRAVTVGLVPPVVRSATPRFSRRPPWPAAGDDGLPASRSGASRHDAVDAALASACRRP
jgi:hypothetical protein